MRWDQGLLTLFLTIVVTVIGVVACGPSTSRVGLKPNLKTVRAFDQCAAKVGARNDRMIGGEKKPMTVPVCGVVMDGPERDYRPIPSAVAYKVGSSGKKKLGLSVEVGVDVPSLDDKDAMKVVDALSRSCHGRIIKLWNDSRMNADLSLRLELASDKSTTVYDHILYLDGTPTDGFVMAQWPDRAKLTMASQSDLLAKCATVQRGEERTKCRRAAVTNQDDVNTEFCIQLTVMTAHYLGLAAEDARAGKCVATPVPAANPDARDAKATAKPKANSILDFARNPALRGPKFWTEARFTDGDRRTIMEAACTN